MILEYIIKLNYYEDVIININNKFNSSIILKYSLIS